MWYLIVSISDLCILTYFNLNHMIGLIHKWPINIISSSGVNKLVLLYNCKQNITSLSLLVGTIVYHNLANMTCVALIRTMRHRILIVLSQVK